MSKKVKMILYGEPGVGKSVFALKWPSPFFITTDPNYQWLEDFGAKEEDHKQVYSWNEFKQFMKTVSKMDKYETIVIDLTEDLFKFCEKEFCDAKKVEHVSDIGYGKGYGITREDFFMTMCQLIALDKHILFLSHAKTIVEKDRRGVEHTRYVPNNRVPDAVWDMLEGRVRYCLRCYLKAEAGSNDTLVKRRYLSLVPKENEFGVARGIDENTAPHDIELDFDTFASVIGLEGGHPIPVKKPTRPKKGVVTPSDEVAPNNESIEASKVSKVIEDNSDHAVIPDPDEYKVEEAPANPTPVETAPVRPKESVASTTTENKTLTAEERLAAIKARIAAIKK